MSLEVPARPRIRLAAVVESISHFEVPLFRLINDESALEFKVFYLNPAESSRFDKEYDHKIEWGVDLLNGYPSKYISSAGNLYGEINDWGAHAVLVYGFGWHGALKFILRNRINKRPMIHRGLLSFYRDPRNPLRARLMRPFRRLLLKLFRAHHFGGDYSYKVLKDAAIEDRSLFFVPYSVDSGHFLAASSSQENQKAAENLRASYGWHSSDRVLLYIGQHNWVKGPDIAMHVFRNIADADDKARFLIVGSGRVTKNMQAFAAEHFKPGVVRFAGFVPSHSTVPYYLSSDLVICTSRYETWARMVNEAMICGRPCVINRFVAASGGLVEDGLNGFVVDSLEPGQYTTAISTYFEMSADARREMRESARLKAMEFAYEPNMGNMMASVAYAITSADPVKPG